MHIFQVILLIFSPNNTEKFQNDGVCIRYQKYTFPDRINIDLIKLKVKLINSIQI